MRYRFEAYCLDTDRRELSRDGSLIHLEPQVYDVLEYLVRNREHVVSRDELISSVWGGRIVSDSALTTRINGARAAIGDSGELQRLIRTLPRRGFRFTGTLEYREEPSQGDVAAAAIGNSRNEPAFPEKPSIAVLPFENLTGDPEQDYFTDGVVEGIILALSRFAWLLVIARNSSFTYKGQAVDVKRVGRELGVRYVLEGSLQKNEGRVRITAQLIEAATGAHLSGERYDGLLEDIFSLQDQVTESVVGSISPKLEKAEIVRAMHKPTDSLDSYDYFLRGMAFFYKWTKASHDEALRLFRKSNDIDPDFATAFGMSARCYSWRAANGWMIDQEKESSEAILLARRAIDRGRDDAVALSTAGHTIACLAGDLDAGVVLVDRALALNPNLATAWLYSGWIRVWSGEHDEAIKHLTHAMRLSPVDPQMFNIQAGIASAHFIAGRYKDACTWSDRALSDQPAFGPALRIAVAGHALVGNSGQARRLMDAMRQADPAVCISNIKYRVPWGRSQDLARLVEGLHEAGLPD